MKKYLFFVILLIFAIYGIFSQIRTVEDLISISFEGQNMIVKNNSPEYAITNFSIGIVLIDTFTNNSYECGGPEDRYSIDPGDIVSIPMLEFSYLPLGFEQYNTPMVFWGGTLGIRTIRSAAGSNIIMIPFQWPAHKINHVIDEINTAER
ncbi:MAG: hypothetical protein FWG89_06655 [Treponema sp.]|nr:hypothetical protein [Treponema sp.]